jgi:hypothetical protein
MADHDERRRPPDTSSRLRRSPAQQEEAERVRAFEAIEATFPAVASASGDELAQMAIHALGFDAASLAASLGIARSEGETLIRSPGSLSRRQRSLLAQYLEMRGDMNAASRNRMIATKLRESIAEADRRHEVDYPPTDTPRQP